MSDYGDCSGRTDQKDSHWDRDSRPRSQDDPHRPRARGGPAAESGMFPGNGEVASRADLSYGDLGGAQRVLNGFLLRPAVVQIGTRIDAHITWVGDPEVRKW